MAEQVYTVTKLEDDLLMIAERHVRMFLVLGETSALLVDTGFGDGDLAAFVKTLTDLPLTVVITHADGDHTGAHRLRSAGTSAETRLHPRRSGERHPVRGDPGETEGIEKIK